MAYTLYHAKGCGSVAVQVALRVLDVRHILVELDYDETAARTNKDTPEFQAFATANPLGLFHQTSFGDVDSCITSQHSFRRWSLLMGQYSQKLLRALCVSHHVPTLKVKVTRVLTSCYPRSPRRAAWRRYAVGTREPHIISACVVLPLDDLHTREHLSTYHTHG